MTVDIRSLPSGVVLGENVVIEDLRSFRRYRSIQDPGLVIGDRSTVFSWTEFSIEPDAVIEVGNDTVLVGAILMCAERIAIGSHVVISYGVTIADCDFHPVDPTDRRQDAMAVSPAAAGERVPMRTAPIVIEEGVRVGIGSIILKGVTIGAGAEISAGSVVTESVPAGALVDGNPGRVVDRATP